MDNRYCFRVATGQRSGFSFSCPIVSCLNGLMALEVLVRPCRTICTPCSLNKIPGTSIVCSSEHLHAKARAMRVTSFQDSHFNDRSVDDPNFFKNVTTLCTGHVAAYLGLCGKLLSLTSLLESAVQQVCH